MWHMSNRLWMYSEKIPKVIRVVNYIVNRRGHSFMLSMSIIYKIILVAKIHTNLPNIGQVMTSCVNWHSFSGERVK